MDHNSHAEIAGKDDGVDVPAPNTGGAVRESKADIGASVIMFLVGAFVAVESYGMPSMKLSGSTWYTMPGIFPMALGCLLMVTSAIMACVVYSRTAGLTANDVKHAIRVAKSPYAIRLGIALAFLVIYVFVLLGRLPYMLATFLYLAPNMIVFDPQPMRPVRVVKYLIISAVFAVAVGYCFENFARIPLP